MDLNSKKMGLCLLCYAVAGAIVYESVVGEDKYPHLPHDSDNTTSQTSTYISPATIGTAQTSTSTSISTSTTTT